VTSPGSTPHFSIFSRNEFSSCQRYELTCIPGPSREKEVSVSWCKSSFSDHFSEAWRLVYSRLESISVSAGVFWTTHDFGKSGG
jgi:hypothetical protein